MTTTHTNTHTPFATFVLQSWRQKQQRPPCSDEIENFKDTWSRVDVCVCGNQFGRCVSSHTKSVDQLVCLKFDSFWLELIRKTDDWWRLGWFAVSSAAAGDHRTHAPDLFLFFFLVVFFFLLLSVFIHHIDRRKSGEKKKSSGRWLIRSEMGRTFWVERRAWTGNG